MTGAWCGPGPCRHEGDQVRAASAMSRGADEFLFLAGEGEVAAIRGGVEAGRNAAPPVVRSCLAICWRFSAMAGPSTFRQEATMESCIEMSM